ncbi:DnaQ-like DNA polymerase III subunit [Streptomyces phage Forrest]|uniref:DnaQ-like exonuclease n=2 Tax=Gilsonvirus gilson TaxID=2846398 RepID=A0A3Q9R4T8_9CAUD|nr:dnaq-like exonuclease [Streptomyces phage Gilson]AZU97160.1 DnaQ-like exonuclease [Streptomyces phage Gilson]QQV92449.1 DnaQ-like DNA polymerase III subunit [Streptomyces phage MeganTheeKilla]QZE11221.1 DnaQ-like DNA polymerase III subunit [Streptomyces phage Forrest]QZE11448.1 DnaQ-like DNA polymerase III subunit [Streptomyces phage Jada]
MKELVFVDTETTGLDASSDYLVELSYARLEGDIKTLYFGVKEVPDFIDNLTKFYERGVDKMPEATMDEIREFLDVMEGNTMVAANPAFDKTFLESEALWNAHYRMLDIESYAMARLGLDEVPSMFKIVQELEKRGYVLTQPDHSSYNDVKALREAYKILRYM